MTRDARAVGDDRIFYQRRRCERSMCAHVRPCVWSGGIRTAWGDLQRTIRGWCHVNRHPRSPTIAIAQCWGPKRCKTVQTLQSMDAAHEAYPHHNRLRPVETAVEGGKGEDAFELALDHAASNRCRAAVSGPPSRPSGPGDSVVVHRRRNKHRPVHLLMISQAFARGS